ncbi:MAG: RidA family protein [Comamonadaceae bacterium]|nr:MAG: RidA family protein [Comamonadaceae bacterium]
MAIQRLETNARMSHIVLHAGTVYLAGAVAQNFDQGIEAQTREALAEVEAALSRVGSSKKNILTTQIWLRDIERDFDAMNSVWEAWLPAGAAPARATCQARMAAPDILVELIVTAALSEP